MTFGWLALGVLGLCMAWLVTFALLKMASDNDRSARHAERKLIPFSEVTVTRNGYGD